MSLVLKARVKQTSTTTGTGTFTLGAAATGYQALASTDNGQVIPYVIEGVDVPGEWEEGLGVYTHSGTTLARSLITASSNSGAAVNFSAGSKNVFLDVNSYVAKSFLLIGEALALPQAMP